MASNFDPSTLFNPVALWTDLGLRAIDMTVSSTQSISEGVDRFARAGASVEASEVAASSSAAARRSESITASGMALAADLQRSSFDLLMRGWVQWMATLGNLASLGAGIAAPALARGNLLSLESMRRTLLPAGGTRIPVAGAQTGTSSREESRRARESRAERGSMEHALASSAEPKRRRSTSRNKPKARRSRAA